jgi:hypothetical protein
MATEAFPKHCPSAFRGKHIRFESDSGAFVEASKPWNQTSRDPRMMYIMIFIFTQSLYNATHTTDGAET